jgi:hypothetical protein
MFSGIEPDQLQSVFEISEALCRRRILAETHAAPFGNWVEGCVLQ